MNICRGCYFFTGSHLTEMGYCGKHGINIHERTSMESNCYLQKKDGEKQSEELINTLYDELNVKYNEYIVWFSDDDNIKIKIKQDINRPNNPDDYDLISEHVINNYGFKQYEIIELSTLNCVII